MLAGPCLREESVEGVISNAGGIVCWHLAIWLYAMLQAVELPAGAAHLDTGLADVEGDHLAHLHLAGPCLKLNRIIE